MYQNNQKAQQNECLICFSPIYKDPLLLHYVQKIPICKKCLSQFDVIDKHILFYNHPLYILYRYNSFFQTLLYQYKGLYDHALKDVFLCYFINEFKERYKDYMVIVAPSNDEENEKRGFAPMEEIASTFSRRVFTGLYKKERYKQSELSYTERKSVQGKIEMRNGNTIKNKKVLIIDDVLTSGSTLLACLSLVLKYNPQRVELLVLSTKQNIEELRFA